MFKSLLFATGDFVLYRLQPYLCASPMADNPKIFFNALFIYIGVCKRRTSR